MIGSRAHRLQILFPFLVASATACGGATIGDPSEPGGPTKPSPTSPTSPTTPTTPPSTPEPTDPPEPVPGGFNLPLQCTDTIARWKAATPSASYDGFEVRRGKGSVTEIEVVSTLAPLCSSAKDATACHATTGALTAEGWDPWGGADGGFRQYTPEFVVTTSGDQVRAIRTLDELATALSPIETADEAAILVALRGYTPVCASGAGSVPAARKSGSGYELLVRSGGTCGEALKEAVIRVDANGTVTVISEVILKPAGPNPCGRRPAGLEPRNGDSDDATLGGLLARMAWLEAASVPAFAALGRDLARHGAPPELLARIEQARKDEVRHARITRDAARRHGATPPIPRLPRAKPRSLFEIALENAVEGCVGEAFGALVATHQAQNATDPQLAAMFASIAADETEHAALSLDLAEWLAPRLSRAEREELARARAAAFAELHASLAVEPSFDERTRGGMPSTRVGRALLAALDEVLLAA